MIQHKQKHQQYLQNVGLTNIELHDMLALSRTEQSMTITVNIYEAKKNLSGLIDEVVNDKQDVVICKYGHPMVRMVPIAQEDVRPKNGFAKDYLNSIQFELPDDFDVMMQDEISALFEGSGQ